MGEDAGVTIAFDGWMLSHKKITTIVILCILLLLRYSSSYLAKLWGEYQDFYFILATFPFLVLVIWLNKDDLQSLHIDKPFILIFILLGILLTTTFLHSYLGIVSAAGTIFVFVSLTKQKFHVDNIGLKSSWITTTILGLIPVLLIRVIFFEQIFRSNYYNVGWMLTSRLWGVIYEEMVFRGILWMVLEKLKINEKNILIIQAFLFWLAHIENASKLSFWLVVPLASLWFGYLVLRSKSLTPSTISHFAYNFTAAVVTSIL